MNNINSCLLLERIVSVRTTMQKYITNVINLEATFT